MAEDRDDHNPLLELTLVRLREFIREPEALFWVFVFPVLLAFALGIAFRTTTPERQPVAVVQDSPNAAAIADALSASSHLTVSVLSEEDAAAALRTGKVSLVVESTDGESVAYRYDPIRSESRTARLEADDAIQRAAGRVDTVASREDTNVESGARYIDWVLPGLVGINLMGSGMWGLGFAVVTARKNKLLKRLSATPMRRSDYLLSFMFSRFVFLGFEVAAVLVFGWFVFGVAIRGSLLGVAIVSLLGALVFTGLGLLVAARPRTIEGVSGWMNLVMLPMWLLSGTFFSSERFPEAFQPAIKALPLTALNDALRGVINEGLPLTALGIPLAILCAWSVISFLLALKIFRWQ